MSKHNQQLPNPHVRTWRLATLYAVLLALLPSLAINLNYLIAASEGSVPWCNPYWDSCTSISATGRSGLGFYFFKATMLPVAVLYWQYWSICARSTSIAGTHSRHLTVLGAISVIALIVYVSALGAVGDGYQLTRRIGIILYFTLTYLGQLLLVRVQSGPALTTRYVAIQQYLLGGILLIGLLTLILDGIMDNYDAVEDAFEWNIALLLHLNFLFAALHWRTLSLRTRTSDLM